jgi:hypothetical protein
MRGSVAPRVVGGGEDADDQLPDDQQPARQARQRVQDVQSRSQRGGEGSAPMTTTTTDLRDVLVLTSEALRRLCEALNEVQADTVPQDLVMIARSAELCRTIRFVIENMGDDQ